MFTRGPSKTFGGLDDAIRRSMPGRSTTVASPQEEEEGIQERIGIILVLFSTKEKETQRSMFDSLCRTLLRPNPFLGFRPSPLLFRPQRADRDWKLLIAGHPRAAHFTQDFDVYGAASHQEVSLRVVEPSCVCTFLRVNQILREGHPTQITASLRAHAVQERK